MEWRQSTQETDKLESFSLCLILAVGSATQASAEAVGTAEKLVPPGLRLASRKQPPAVQTSLLLSALWGARHLLGETPLCSEKGIRQGMNES